MKRASKLLRVLIAVSALAALVAVALPAGAETSEGKYIVVLKDSAGSSKSVAAEHSRRHGTRTSFVYEHALKGYAATINSSRLGAVRSDPRVEYVEEDGVVTVSTEQLNPTWGLDRIDQRTGLDAVYHYNATGSGVTAYIIDTGIRYSHDEFELSGGGSRASFGYDAISPSTEGNDCDGHGTHVAGTVGGTTYGVAKTVSLISVRVLDCNGSGFWSGVIAGVNWVTEHNAPGAKAVANMSLGGGANTSVDTAVKNSILDGVSYAVAAGNSNRDACNFSPSRVSTAMTIAASGSNDLKASFSNFGSCVDWYAPGVGITSSTVGKTSSTAESDTEIDTFSGTSMASPHTAGVAALYLQNASLISPSDVNSTLLANATQSQIYDSKFRGKKIFKPLLFTDY